MTKKIALELAIYVAAPMTLVIVYTRLGNVGAAVNAILAMWFGVIVLTERYEK